MGARISAHGHRKASDVRVVAITGSVGKTTTRELVHAVLSVEFDAVRSPRNYNNDVGLPLSLLRIEPRHDYAVLELGTSGPGEIAPLAAAARPDVGIVTRVAPAHLAGLGSVEGVAFEKGHLVEAVAPTGFVVLNGDDPRVRAMRNRANCPAILIGESSENDLICRVESVDLGDLRLRVDGSTYRVPATGRQHVIPALAAIALGRELGLSPQAIAEGLRRFEPVAGRSHAERIGPWIVVDDTYNASPAALASACELLIDVFEERPRVLVLGDMLDLGDHTDQYHAEAGRLVAAAGLDHLVVTGAHAGRVAQEARDAGMDAHRLAVCPDFDSLVSVLAGTLEPGSVVLVKGSRATRMERVVAWLRERAAGMEDVVDGPPARAVA